MRTALTALTDELRRLKAAGVATVAVSEEGIAALKAALKDSSEVGSGGRARPFVADNREVEDKPQGSTERTVGRDRPTLPAPKTSLRPPPVVQLPEAGKSERWAALRECVRNDLVCRAQARPGKQVVFGVGSLDAKIMFVGEAPGADEEVQGEPFVGPAGQLLNRMIAAAGLRREDVYIGNIMNWRPALPAGADGVQYGNRPPTAEEMAYCLPYLRAQIEVVHPAILVALGATAAEGLLGRGTFRTLGEIRGQWREFAGTPLMVTYHPSYILRNPTNRSKRLIWEDFLKIMERAGLPISEKQRGYFLGK